MHSLGEIVFRFKQEAANLWLLVAAPEARCEAASPLPKLPRPEAVIAAVRGTPLEQQVRDIADKILAHRFPLLGIEIETGPEIDWNRDYVHGISNPLHYFRRLPYLDFSRAGDHKIIWELNRHQHLVALAQAWLLTRERQYFDELTAHLRHWWSTNPPQRGMNWASALEVAFRVLSWIWVYHLAGPAFDAGFRWQFTTEVSRHAMHLNANLSIYFSPNTHLLGEAVALHAIGVLFPALPHAAEWRRTGARIVAAQMDSQIRNDGSHFEQSSYYHVYAVDFFVFHALLEDVSDSYMENLGRMAEYLYALMYPSGRLPLLGDDDGGRLFHPYGERESFGRATMATCSVLLNRPEWLRDTADLYEQAVWWIGPQVLSQALHNPPPDLGSRFFRDAGVAVMTHGDTHVVVDAGPFGAGSGGHSHSDTLGIVVRRGDADLLIDPGTYTYISDPQWRNRFRGSAAHNTVRVNGRDQAVPTGPFRWTDTPGVRVYEWTTQPHVDRLDAGCTYGGIHHRRVIVFHKPDCLIVFDQVAGPERVTAEQFWHPDRVVKQMGRDCFEIGDDVFLAVAPPAEPVVETGGDYGWRSRTLGAKEPAPVLRVEQSGQNTVVLAAALSFSGGPAGIMLNPSGAGWQVAVTRRGQQIATAVITDRGR